MAMLNNQMVYTPLHSQRTSIMILPENPIFNSVCHSHEMQKLPKATSLLTHSQ